MDTFHSTISHDDTGALGTATYWPRSELEEPLVEN